MPELRTDWLTGRSVLIAENRALRPNEFAEDRGTVAASNSPIRSPDSCAFCPGHETQTPRTEYELLDDAGQWRLRVIRNKYPAVTQCEPSSSTIASVTTAADLSALGAHEVIVETARHEVRTSALAPAELAQVLATYAARLRYWQRDERLAYGLVFKNQGPSAGASLAHLHSQLVALPAVPPAVARELGRAREAFDDHGSCPYCRLIDAERAAGVRMIFEQDGYVAFCPFVSLQPGEIWLLPARHAASFEESLTGSDFQVLAALLYPLVARIESLVPGASFNLLLRTAPWRGDWGGHFHWRIELLPRVNSIAGFETATGMFINPVPPEVSAGLLRGE